MSLSAKEAGEAEITGDDIKSSDEECNRSLFGKVVGDRHAGLLGIKRTMGAIWRMQHSMEVKEISENFFQFIFLSQEDKKKVSAGHNWMYGNQYLILKEWFHGLHSNHSCFDEITLWVQVLNVPLNWMSTEVGQKVGRIFNKVKNVIVCKFGGDVGSFLKLLVAIDLKEPIPRCTSIKLGNQKVMVAFRYEKLVNLCYYCSMIGHLDRSCSKRLRDFENNCVADGQFGEWLKTSETYAGGRSMQSDSSGEKVDHPKTNPVQDSFASDNIISNVGHREIIRSTESGDQSPLVLGEVGGPGDKYGEIQEFVGMAEPTLSNVANHVEDEGRNRMEVEECVQAKKFIIDEAVGELCKADLRKRSGAGWKRQITSKSRLQRVPVKSSGLELSESLKRNRALAGGAQWDINLIKALFSEDDAEKIMRIKTLNPRAKDQWQCNSLAKGRELVCCPLMFAGLGDFPLYF
ncbi:Unknown protein [Striga hermonthica]|uniref:CCHC-type domain-containing protein n=1 Tax=Striga hermonthica TaxID=68872 RepID=A0A9N7P1B5_STRHE|nr:Unknown protein [Striga hermonthica]